MVRRIFLLALIFANSAGAQSPANKGPALTLTQKDAAEMVLHQGFRTNEINLLYQTYSLKPVEALSAYDWKFVLASGLEKDRKVSYTFVESPDIERYRSSLALNKSFLTGTALQLEYSQISQKYISPASTIPINYNLGVLTLEQSLLGNFFGAADRAKVTSAELDYEASKVLRINDLENLVLDTLRQYWDTYVAQQNFKESLAAKDRSEKLVAAVKRKAANGYANPGELSQIQAEYESRQQKVKRASITYLANLENLITLLGLPSSTEINFSVATALPEVPQLKMVGLENLRIVRSQKMKIEAAENALRASRSNKYPNLSAVGQWSSSGLADSASEASSQLTSGKNPQTYYGLKLSYNFGSDLQSQTELNRKAQFELEQSRLNRSLLELTDLTRNVERKVTATYSVAQSMKLEVQFREKAVQELTRTYNQGRTSITDLIRVMNEYFDLEVAYVRAIGDYQIALNEWAAARDELIPEREEK